MAMAYMKIIACSNKPTTNYHLTAFPRDFMEHFSIF